jgi:hypothetical protein
MNTLTLSFRTWHKGLLKFFVICTIATACDDGDDSKINSCLLSKSTVTYHDGGVEEYAYTYDSNDKFISSLAVYTHPNSVVSTSGEECSYDQNGRLATSSFFDDSGIYPVTYTYNSNDQAIKLEYFQGTTKLGYSENEYNASGQLIKQQHYAISATGVATSDWYAQYEYALADTKNVLRIKKFKQDGTLEFTTEYLYDSKKSPWSSVNGGERNNVTKITRTQGTSIQVQNFTYTYTDKGYPAEMTQTDKTGLLVYTEVYTYACK